MNKTATEGNFSIVGREVCGRVATVSVMLDHEDIAVVAYCKEEGVPSIMVTRDKFEKDTAISQKMDFHKIRLEKFKGYDVWCCEIIGEEMRICLMKP